MEWRLGVIGSPTAHSLTPRLHRAALDVLGLSGSSRAVDVSLKEVHTLPGLFEEFDALSVTMPLKAEVMQFCSRLEPLADEVSAVNSLRIGPQTIEGRTTDGAGFLDALRSDFGVEIRGRAAVVRGSGGAARSLIAALHTAGASHITVLARNGERAAVLASRYPVASANPPRVADVAVDVSTVPSLADISEIPDAQVTYTPDAVAIDIQYVPTRTAWLDSRRDQGVRTANGLSMLVHQARHQLEWWFNSDVPLSPLLHAVGL